MWNVPAVIKAPFTDDRRSRVLELIRQRGFASLPALAAELEVSESTVRRDLDFLEHSGVARRTHGGVFYTGPSPKLVHFDQRQSLNWDRKRQIAAAASRLIDDNDTILLDGGSTTYELAQLLVGCCRYLAAKECMDCECIRRSSMRARRPPAAPCTS